VGLPVCRHDLDFDVALLTDIEKVSQLLFEGGFTAQGTLEGVLFQYEADRGDLAVGVEIGAVVRGAVRGRGVAVGGGPAGE
jgi:hypothetical protein